MHIKVCFEPLCQEVGQKTEHTATPKKGRGRDNGIGFFFFLCVCEIPRN